MRCVIASLLVLLISAQLSSVAGSSNGTLIEWTIIDVPAAQEADFPPSKKLATSSPVEVNATAAANATLANIEKLIAYGWRARFGQFPFAASLLKTSSIGSGFYHSCTASLIAPNILLTAAHCFFNITTGAWDPPSQALLGGIDLSSSSNFKEMISLTNFLYPSTYSISGFDSTGGDIGIVVMANTSKLPTVGLAPFDPPVGSPLTAVGWGIDERPGPINRILKYTTLRVSSDACPAPLPNGVICAVGENVNSGISGTCPGDSGGPELLPNGLQAAITSYGPDVGCGTGPWGVYTSVADYLTTFIKPTLDKYGAPNPVDTPSSPNFGNNHPANGPNNGYGGRPGNNGGGANGPGDFHGRPGGGHGGHGGHWHGRPNSSSNNLNNSTALVNRKLKFGRKCQ